MKRPAIAMSSRPAAKLPRSLHGKSARKKVRKDTSPADVTPTKPLRHVKEKETVPAEISPEKPRRSAAAVQPAASPVKLRGKTIGNTVPATPVLSLPRRPATAPAAAGAVSRCSEAAFDADEAAREFRSLEDAWNSASSAVANVRRREALLSKKPRILDLAIKKPSHKQCPPELTVTYRGESPQIFYDRIPLWSLSQMRAFVKAVQARLGTSRRQVPLSSSPLQDSDVVSFRCPPLWWSLALWAVGNASVKSGGSRTKWPPAIPKEFPVVMPGNMHDLLAALVTNCEESIGEEKARKALQAILSDTGGV